MRSQAEAALVILRRCCGVHRLRDGSGLQDRAHGAMEAISLGAVSLPTSARPTRPAGIAKITARSLQTAKATPK